jgi:hypothetical protein
MPIEIVPDKEAMLELDKDSETYKRLKKKYGDRLENLLDKPEKKEDRHKGLKPGEFEIERDPEAPDGMRRVRQAVKSGGAVNKNYAYGGRVAKMSAEKS